MRRYRLTRRADLDIDAIARSSAKTWGWMQAEDYLASLHDAFERLAVYPALGRRIDHIRAGFRQLDHRSHSVYYREDANGVIIVRVLHHRMLAADRLR